MTNEKKLSPLRQKDIRTGAQQERERIIALLESEKWSDGTDPQYSIDDVVALIKGDVVERRQSQMSEYGDKGESQ